MINGIKLNENISPNQRRIRLMELSGIPLTEDEKRYLKPRTESVSMKEIPKNRKGVVPPNYIPQPNEDELDDMDNAINMETQLKFLNNYEIDVRRN